MAAEQGPEGADAESAAGGLSRTTLIWCAVAVGVLTAWFFFAWLVLDRMMLDAAGEAVGTGLLLLVVTSVIGALVRSRSE